MKKDLYTQASAARLVHAVCGICHLVSATVIWIVAIANNSLSSYEYGVSKNFASQGSVWRFQCYQNGTYVDGYTACDDDNKQFGIYTLNPMRTWYNLLIAAVAFAYVSGVVHVIRWHNLETQAYLQKDEQKYRLVYDYAISAPIMLSVINVLWGANTILGIFVAPATLALLLILSYFLITSSMSQESKMLSFYVLVAAYTACLAPTFVATFNAIDPTGKAANEGTAPSFVAAFVAVFFVVFSTFIFPYYLELASADEDGKRKDCFVEFSVLSLIAKITLHAFLGVGVLQQTTMTANIDTVVERGDRPDTVSPSVAFAIAGGAIAVGMFFGLYFTQKFGMLFDGPLSHTTLNFAVNGSLSILSKASFLSVLSVASLGSFASVASIGSILSVSSIGSIGSLHSNGCIGGFFQDCTNGESSGSFVHVPIASAITILFVISIVKTDKMLGLIKQQELLWIAVVTLYALTVVLVVVMYNTSMLCDLGILFVLSAIILFDETVRASIWTSMAVLTMITGYAFIVTSAFVVDNTHASTKTIAVVASCLALACILFAAMTQSAQKAATQTQRPLSTLLSLVLVYVLVITAIITTSLASYSAPKIGTYFIGDNNLNKFGAGPHERYILFDFSQKVCKDAKCAKEEPLQSWSKLHREDKYNVMVTLGGKDADISETAWTVGVEQKGKDRDVPNLSIEFRDPNEDFDDKDVQIFTDAFDEKYSDWWITFGAPGDLTHARQSFANKANNVPSAIIDVLSKNKDGQISYEGVALLLPAFKKGLYENYNGLSDNPYGDPIKWKCDKDNKDGPITKSDGSFLQDYDDGNTIKSEFAKTILDRGFMNASRWKMIYPKSSLIEDAEKCTAAGSAKLQSYQNTMQKMLHTKSFENVRMDMFVRTYIWEIILQDTDFPFRSSKYAYNVQNEQLLPGFLWDYNSPSYRALSPEAPFKLRNIYPTFAWTDPLKFWQHTCEQQPKLFYNFTENVTEALQDVQQALDNLTNASHLFVETFDRSKRRNNEYGTFVGSVLDIVLGTVKDMTTKDSYKKEFDYQINRMQRRLQYLKTHLKESCTTTEVHYVDYVLAMLSFILIMFFAAFTALLLSMCCLDKPASAYASFEMYDMAL